MAADLPTNEIVTVSVTGLGYELVDLEQSAGGLMRVFIDKPGGISVEDCANVSNHLTRVFAVENIEFERLEVSSPGLDRPLKALTNYQQFLGRAVKVRLNTMVDDRKRFDGLIEAVEGNLIVFLLTGAESTTKAAGRVKQPVRSKRANLPEVSAKRIRVPFESIDKARLIPDF